MKPYLPAVLIFTLAACAQINPGAPTVLALDAPTLDLRSASVQWPTTQWWLRYQDPQLNALIAHALEDSPSLDIAQARVLLANAAVRSARAVQWPQINAQYQMTRQRYSENYIYPAPLGGAMNTDNSLQLQLDLDLDLWGKNRSLQAAAQSRARAAAAEQQQARNTLIAATTQSYFQLQGALAQAAAIETIVTKLREVLDITNGRFNNGLGTQVDVDQAASAVSSAQVQLSQARNNAQLLRHQLAMLIAVGPTQGPDIQLKAGGPLPEGVPESLPMDLLGRRPDIVAAGLQAQAAGSEVSAAKADFYPNINLSAFAGFMSLGMDKLMRGTSQDYGVGPAISLPILHGGALNAQLEGRRSARDLAIAQYNQTLLNAVREVADANTSIRSLGQQLQDQKAGLEAISSAYDIALKRYKAGLGNFVQVLLAQNEVLKQAVLTTDLHARAYILDAQLATALGGGYRAPEPPAQH
ncbi:efflux transporter outer membrane subunit [Alcaligenaceae bacterium CGII-47]|nr:efflux transporter outer membrane subunit [Alcaligenaceae bacterium CGII-47]